MNDTRSLFYSRRFALRSRLLVLVCFGTQVLSPLTAFAEVGLLRRHNIKTQVSQVTKPCNAWLRSKNRRLES